MSVTRKAALLAVALLLACPAAYAGAGEGSPLAGVGAALQPGDGARQHDALNLDELKRRLAEKGLGFGSAIMIRIFKIEAELELWVENGDRFELFAVYSICNWSGALGPKLAEGDRQSPEGFYSVSANQLRRSGRWRRSLDLGFPNTYDKIHGRTGSYILVHGGCSTIGCYAMTDPAMEEIFALSEAALSRGQEHIQVHVFPFRMTQRKLRMHGRGPWSGFWLSLKSGYDLFERMRRPPEVRVCDDHYALVDGPDGGGPECVANISEPSVASTRARNVHRAAARKHRARRARVARRSLQARRNKRGNARQAHAARSPGMQAASHLGGPLQKRK